MFTRNFRGFVFNYPPTVDPISFFPTYKPIPDLARSQVYHIGHAPECFPGGDGSIHYQVSVFSDAVLPTAATFLFEASTCAATTDLAHWDHFWDASSNLKTTDATLTSIWFSTSGFGGAYDSITEPWGKRQNERVIRVLNASTGTITATTVLDGDVYGVSYTGHEASQVVARPGADHCFWIIPAGSEVTKSHDVASPFFPTFVKTPGRILKVNTSGGIVTEVILGLDMAIASSCVDYATGDLWVAFNDMVFPVTSGYVLNRYNSSLSLISSTPMTNIIQVMAFSNFGGVPIIYLEETGTPVTTIRRFNVGTLSFLSNVTIPIAIVHAIHGATIIDSFGGYLYRASSTSLIAFRLSDFAVLGLCVSIPYSQPFVSLTDDCGKLYNSGQLILAQPYRTGCWVAPYYGLVGFSTAHHGDITSIEEDWELQLDTPLTDQGSPVVNQTLIISTGCSVFYRATMHIGFKGAQLQLKQGFSTTTDDTVSQNTPNPNELITWTTKLDLSGSNIVITIPSASSATIPDLTALTLSTAPAFPYIGDYEPEWSINGFVPGGFVPGNTALQGTEIFFDNGQSAITHLKRTGYRVYFSNAITVTPTSPDTIVTPWPVFTVNDIGFVISYFAGKKAIAILIDQVPKIGYVILQDVPNIVNKIDLITRTILATAIVPGLLPYVGEFDPVGQQLYFPAKVGVQITSVSTGSSLTFSPSNVAYVIRRDTGESIYTVDTSTGALTFVGTPGVTIASLVFDGVDLYGISGEGGDPSNLYKINPLNGSIITTYPYSGYDHIVSLARRPSDGQLFGWVNGDVAGLVTISKVTGLATSIGGVSTNISDMTFHPLTGILYATNSTTSTIKTVNTANGVLTTVVPTLPFSSGYSLAWDFQATPVLWFKYGSLPATLTTVNLTLGIINGPLLAKLDAGSMTVTLGGGNADAANANVAVFDIANDFGYLAFKKIYKYQLSTLAVVNTLNLSADPTMLVAAIDTVGGFAYFVHDNIGSGVKITKVDLGSFTVSLTTTITPTSIPDIKAAIFMNGFLYLIDVLGFVRKIDPTLVVVDTLQLPKTPAQTAYTVNFDQTVPVLGQLAIDPVNDHIYVGINNLGTGTSLGSAIYKIEATGLTVLGSLQLNTLFENFNAIQATALRNDGIGYGMTNTVDGNIIEFGLAAISPPSWNIGPSTAPDGVIAIPYNFPMSVDSEDAPGSVITAVSSGSLPPGLVITGSPGITPAITGIPTTLGLYAGEITVTDSFGNTPEAFSINITSLPDPNEIPCWRYKVKLNRLGEQGYLDVNPATGDIMQPSQQRTMHNTGAFLTYRSAPDNQTFTDCTYWDRFTTSTLLPSIAFVDLIGERSIDPYVFSSYVVLTTDTFTTNAIDICGLAKYVQMKNNGTGDVLVKINDLPTAIMTLKAGTTQVLNTFVVTKLAFSGGATDTMLEIIISSFMLCNT